MRNMMGMSRTPLLAGFSLLAVSVMAAVAVSQTQPATRDAPDAPASRPVTQPSADQILGNMLKPRRTGQERELSVTDPPAVDKKSGPGSVAPAAAPQTVMREGTPVINRIGRITVGAEGAPSEFVFQSEGGALHDPALHLLPCRDLMLR